MKIKAAFQLVCERHNIIEVCSLLYINKYALKNKFKAVIDGKPKMVQFLVEHGANVNAQDNEGFLFLLFL